jgi:hypothetical protein
LAVTHTDCCRFSKKSFDQWWLLLHRRALIPCKSWREGKGREGKRAAAAWKLFLGESTTRAREGWHGIVYARSRRDFWITCLCFRSYSEVAFLESVDFLSFGVSFSFFYPFSSWFLSLCDERNLLAKKKLLRDRREKQLSRVLITLRTVAGRKFWRRRSALVSGRWYYFKNVTSGLLAEDSQRRRRRRKIADQLANVGRQIGKDFATCNKNREVLLTNCCNISPKNWRKSLCLRERARDQFILDRGKENAFRNSERGGVRNRRRGDSATEAKKES